METKMYVNITARGRTYNSSVVVHFEAQVHSDSDVCCCLYHINESAINSAAVSR